MLENIPYFTIYFFTNDIQKNKKNFEFSNVLFLFLI